VGWSQNRIINEKTKNGNETDNKREKTPTETKWIINDKTKNGNEMEKK
jgi:hypothetical protein